MADAPRLAASVVIPTRNRHGLLAELLVGLTAQDLGEERYEIIVVDDRSKRPVQVPSGVRLIRNPRRGVNAARNLGADAALSALVCFLDDDVAVPPGWLREVVQGAERHPEADCFGGPVRVRLEGVPARWLCPRCAGSTLGESPLDLGVAEGATDAHVNGGNMGIRHRALVAAGRFDEERPQGGEESEWQDRLRRVGGSICYLPAAWLWHRRTPEQMRFRCRLSRSFRRGRGDAFYARSRGDHAQLRPRRLIGGLAHAARSRCQAGLLGAAWEAAFMVGSLEYVVRSRRGPSGA